MQSVTKLAFRHYLIGLEFERSTRLGVQRNILMLAVRMRLSSRRPVLRIECATGPSGGASANADQDQVTGRARDRCPRYRNPRCAACARVNTFAAVRSVTVSVADGPRSHYESPADARHDKSASRSEVWPQTRRSCLLLSAAQFSSFR